MRICWHGHSCFSVEFGDKRLIFDPFHASNGIYYSTDFPRADYVLCSHDHFDHNAVELVPGNPSINPVSPDDFSVEVLEEYHDSSNGKLYGLTKILILEIEGKKLVHLGDIGRIPSKDVLSKLTNCDVMMIPVGGHYTIGPKEAINLVSLTTPRFVLPMHYKTKLIDFPIEPVSVFLQLLIEPYTPLHLDENRFNPDEVEPYKVVVFPLPPV